mgnify:CR=1 FL=1
MEEKQSTKTSNVQRNNPEQNDSVVNFQFASNTLDTSVKIYACRVDNVHNETYKVLGGLARSDKEKENHIDDVSPEIQTGNTKTSEETRTKAKKRVSLRRIHIRWK